MTPKTLAGLSALGLCVVPASLCLAWGYPTHSRLAEAVLRHPSLRLYVEQFPRFGLDAEKIARGCDHEPPRRPVNYNDDPWGNLSNLSYQPPAGFAPSFVRWEIQNERLSNLLHLACDSSVPICHSPSNSVYGPDAQAPRHKQREDRFEVLAVFHGMPSLRDEDLLKGTYAEKIETWRKRQLALAERFRDHSGDDAVFYDECFRQAMSLAHAVLIEYCRRNGIGPPENPAAATQPAGPVKKHSAGRSAGEGNQNCPAAAGNRPPTSRPSAKAPS